MEIESPRTPTQSLSERISPRSEEKTSKKDKQTAESTANKLDPPQLTKAQQLLQGQRESLKERPEEDSTPMTPPTGTTQPTGLTEEAKKAAEAAYALKTIPVPIFPFVGRLDTPDGARDAIKEYTRGYPATPDVKKLNEKSAYGLFKIGSQVKLGSQWYTVKEVTAETKGRYASKTGTLVTGQTFTLNKENGATTTFSIQDGATVSEFQADDVLTRSSSTEPYNLYRERVLLPTERYAQQVITEKMIDDVTTITKRNDFSTNNLEPVIQTLSLRNICDTEDKCESIAKIVVDRIIQVQIITTTESTAKLKAEPITIRRYNDGSLSTISFQTKTVQSKGDDYLSTLIKELKGALFQINGLTAKGTAVGELPLEEENTGICIHIRPEPTDEILTDKTFDDIIRDIFSKGTFKVIEEFSTDLSMNRPKELIFTIKTSQTTYNEFTFDIPPTGPIDPTDVHITELDKLNDTIKEERIEIPRSLKGVSEERCDVQ